ncbi:MAG: uroporphyrinogen decarboxylase family protein [Vicinamibacterales bacterium]
MVFDTAAGELAPDAFGRDVGPDLAALARAFPNALGYYAKGVEAAHFSSGGWAASAPWAGIGLDWHWDLAQALAANGRTGFVQGNFDPSRLVTTGRTLEDEIARFVAPMQALSPDASGASSPAAVSNTITTSAPPSSCSRTFAFNNGTTRSANAR